jgi:hypothetical protein
MQNIPLHTTPHDPQFCGSLVMSAHPDGHGRVPCGQPWHMPAAQVTPAPHEPPHPPQLFGSVSVSTHTPPQLVVPPVHEVFTHALIWHPAPAGHTTWQPPQFTASLVTSTQPPSPQSASVVPHLGGWHLPPAHE